MEVYAALLLHEAKKEINEENIKKILNSIGASVDEAKIKVLVSTLQNVNIDEILKQPLALASAPQERKEEKKEEEKKEEEEKAAAEAAVAGLGALFG